MGADFLQEKGCALQMNTVFGLRRNNLGLLGNCQK